MSVIVSGEVRRRLNLSGGIFTLALELADTANHDGTGIFRGARSLADYTRQGVRTVHRQMRKLRDLGWLVMVRRKYSKKYPCPLYRISADWIRGASLATLPDLNLSRTEADDAELPFTTRRVATSGKQSVHNPSMSQDPRSSLDSARARAIPTGSRGANRRGGKEPGLKAESLSTRMRKAKKLLQVQPDHPPKSIKRMFLLTDDQLAQVQAS